MGISQMPVSISWRIDPPFSPTEAMLNRCWSRFQSEAGSLDNFQLLIPSIYILYMQLIFHMLFEELVIQFIGLNI
jgi:hypothetical protein